MQSWLVTKRGTFERRSLAGEALPKGKVRVRVKYAGVGFADVMAAKGHYILAPSFPFSPGYELMGLVEESSEQEFPAGTRVIALLAHMGAFRSWVDIDPSRLVAIPDSISDEAAAQLPLNVTTAAALIEKSARLESGSSFLIVGGSGGVGQAALAWAKNRRLTAYATAAPHKADVIERWGGIPLDAHEDWPRQLRRLRPQGVDAAFDAFGPASFQKSWAALGSRGRLVAFGFSPTIEGGWSPFLKGLAYLGGKMLTGWPRQVAACSAPRLSVTNNSWYRSIFTETFSAIKTGTFPLTEPEIVDETLVPEVFERFARREVTRKILLTFSR